MHKSTKLTPFTRKEIYTKYKERMMETRGKEKETFYKEIAPLYRVHYNIIRKVCKRWRLWDFKPHKYTRVKRPQTNGKIERFWRIFEEQFFRKYTFSSNKDFNMKFKDWLVFYNTKRKHWWIKFITPMQKLEILLENNMVCL